MNRTIGIVNYLIASFFLGSASLQAGTSASWNFEDIPSGSAYGTTTIIATTSLVNNVVAEGFANDPLYIRGADGVGHGMASGYLRVAGSAATESLFSGFTALNFSFDARLAAAPAATQIIFNYGVTLQSWSVYVTSDSVLHFKMYDSTGVSVDLNTYMAGMPADGSYHHYEIVWNGSSVQILRDGTAQLLENGSSDSWAVTLGTVRSAGVDGQIGIGGMIRDNLSVAYEFSGFLDNIAIVASKADPVLGGAWSFDEGSVGVDIVSSADSVSALLAVPSANNITDPAYVMGSGGGVAAGFAGISGILEVDEGDTKALGSGFSKLSVIFDVDLAADATATAVLIRNGHLNLSYNIYLLPENIIAIQLQDAASGLYSTVKTAASAISAGAGWQNVSIIWDGSAVSIYVDGIAQMLYGGAPAIAVSTVSLMASDAPMGIGGLRRSDGSIGLFFNGSLDNIVIRNTTPFIELFGITGN